MLLNEMCSQFYGINSFLLTLYVIFLFWVVVLMEKTKCMEKYMYHFTIVVAVPIQDHILFAKDHSNSRWTKVITFVGPLYNLYIVFFSCPRPKTNIVFSFESNLFIYFSTKELLQSCQNEKDWKFVLAAQKMVSFFSAASCKKDPILVQLKQIFIPSTFMTACVFFTNLTLNKYI